LGELKEKREAKIEQGSKAFGSGFKNHDLGY